MKYIKLFENFNNEEDILYDIEQILIGLNTPSSGSYEPELLRNELNGNLLFYKVDNNYTPEDYQTAVERLVDLGYFIKLTTYGLALIKSDYFEDKTIKGVCLQWLNEKFGKGKLEIVDDNRVPGKEAINYVDKETGETIIKFYKQRNKDDNFLINNDLVWSIFKGFKLSYGYTQEIISTWLEETYELTGMTPFSWIPPPQ